MAFELLSRQTLIDLSDDEPSQSSLQDFLQPLQETADRVSQQVEEFAKRLHKFNTDRASDDQTLWEDAWTLLDDFRGIAHTRAEATSTRSPRSSRRRSAGDSGVQLAKIDLEADIWDLTKRMLMCKSPRAAADAQSAQEERLNELHRYSTDSELWNAFLDSDITGQEYESVLDWLQERAQKTEPPIEDTIQNLTEKSERGHGVWSAGPMFTKNSIKQQKRSRGLASPLQPSNNSRPKVSQLDPDAQTRQNASLEDQDEFHEEAAWMTCWELLRRGKSLEDVRSWWTDRNEQWRSLALRGCLTMSIDELQSPWYRIMSLSSNPSWVAQCRTLCRSNALSNAFQRAVYGILCGDAPASHEVCGGIDEHLFATFNSLLIERYQHYAAAYRKKLASNNSATYQPPIVDQNSVRRAVQSATATVRGRVDMQETHKAIQMAIMDTYFDTFFVAVGRAAAESAYSSKDVFRHLMSENIDDSNIPISAMNIVRDFDSARVVAHMQIVMRSLGLLPSYEQNEYLMENNITSYIGWLQKDKKWDLIPTYASHLSKQRIQMVLGTIFINITDEKERSLQVRLLKKYKIDVAEVLYGIFALANYQNLTRFQSPNFRFSAPRITELNGTGKAALLKLKHEFMGLEPSPEDERIVSSVEWYRHIEAPNWGKACYSVSFLYKLWLCEGNLEAAKMLPERANLADISLNALGMNLMFGEDTEEAEAELHTNGKSDDTSDHSLSPSRSRKLQQLHPLARGVSTRKALFDQSVVWMHLELLVTALDALNTFQAWADDLDRYGIEHSPWK
jgi:nuclear pore complex protein Nup107